MDKFFSKQNAYEIGGYTPIKYVCPVCGNEYYDDGSLWDHWMAETGGEYVEPAVLHDVSRAEADAIAAQYAAMHPELELVQVCGYYTDYCICNDCGERF